MDENGDPSKSLAIVSLLRVLENERRNEKCGICDRKCVCEGGVHAGKEVKLGRL